MCGNPDNTHFLLEPAHGLLFTDTVPETDAACFPLLVSDAEAGSAQNLSTKREQGWSKTLKLNINSFSITHKQSRNISVYQ